MITIISTKKIFIVKIMYVTRFRNEMYVFMSFWGLKSILVPKGIVPVANSTATRRVKPTFVTCSCEERMWNVRLHSMENLLSYVIHILRRTLPTKVAIIK